MDEKLENKLYEKYPKLFRQKDLPMQETCMCWGLECNAGYFWLINNLCSCIQNYIDDNNKPQVEFVQIKQKFGMLRVYIDGGDELIRGMIWLAESFSWQICEVCGTTQNIVHTNGWIESLCKNCLSNRKLNKQGRGGLSFD